MKIVAFTGPPCSGKSTLAAAVCERLGLAHLEMDRIRSRLMPEGTNRREERALAYRAMHLLAETLLQAGRDVALDATYGPHDQRREVEEISERTGAALYVVQCVVSEEDAVARLGVRTAEHPARDLDSVRVRTLARTYPYFPAALSVEQTEALECRVVSVQAYLATGAPVPVENRAWSDFAAGRWDT